MSAAPFLGATPGQLPQASQVNQLLVTHPMTVLYTGAVLVQQTTAGVGSTASNGLWMAQSFTPSGSHAVNRVVLTLAVTGSPAPWVVSIQADNSGAPSGTPLVSASLPNSFVPGSPGAVSIPLPVTLTAGNYWIVMTAVGDVSDFYAASRSNQASGASTSTNGSTWTAQGYGFLYQLFDQSTIPPLVHLWVDSGARWATFVKASGGQINNLYEYTTAQGGSYVQSAASYAYTGGLLASVTQNATNNAPQPWSAARSGLLGDTGAVDASAQINQFLGAHNQTIIYFGNGVVVTNGSGGGFIPQPLSQYDIDQPFTMSGTSIGRVRLPLVPVGTGSDLIVSLCNDNAGVPGTVITQTRIPANWFTQFSKYTILSGSDPYIFEPTNSPVATGWSNQIVAFQPQTLPWNTATLPGGFGGVGTTGPAVVGNGTDTVLFIGGLNGSNNYVGNAYSSTYAGGTTLNAPVPQPPVPIGIGSYAATGITTDPTSGAQFVVTAGGATGNSGSFTTIASVYAAGLSGGQLTAWSQQPDLPQAMQTANGATWGTTSTSSAG